ncbi:MAG: DUF1007 family protein [Pseudomonadota bacterium]
MMVRRLREMGLCAVLALALVVQVWMAAPAGAHPHAWIDLRSTVVLNKAGQAIALEQEWLFDDFYTAVATEASDGAKGKKTDWMELAKTNLDSLKAYNYFTEIRSGGEKVTLGTVTDYDSEVRGGRLWMRFVVPFESPVDPKATDFSFSVFDPSYYIEILHMKGDVVAFRGPSATSCRGHILTPTPTTEMLLLAQAIDDNAKTNDGLGKLFAERVDISCR